MLALGKAEGKWGYSIYPQGETTLPSREWMNYVTSSRTSTKWEFWTRPSWSLGPSRDLSPSSPLELMVRIIAHIVQPKNLEQNQEELRKLNVTKQYQNLNVSTGKSETILQSPEMVPDNTKKSQGPPQNASWAEIAKTMPKSAASILPGVPKIVFIGISADKNLDSPQRHVITSLGDCWPNCSWLYDSGERDKNVVDGHLWEGWDWDIKRNRLRELGVSVIRS